MRSLVPARVPSLVVLLGALILRPGPIGADRAAHAQPTTQPGPPRPATETGRYLGGLGRPGAAADTARSKPSVRRVLLGSVLGTAGGVGLGVALVQGARAADRNRADPSSDDPNRPDPTVGLALVGAALIVGGGPFGAVQMGGIERGRGGAYVLGGVGEFVVGGLGYALANRIHESRASRLTGLGVGWVLGAAGGALLAASQRKRSTGLVGYRKEAWHVSRPTVQVRPGPTLDRPSVGVTLLSVRLQ